MGITFVIRPYHSPTSTLLCTEGIDPNQLSQNQVPPNPPRSQPTSSKSASSSGFAREVTKTATAAAASQPLTLTLRSHFSTGSFPLTFYSIGLRAGHVSPSDLSILSGELGLAPPSFHGIGAARRDFGFVGCPSHGCELDMQPNEPKD